MARKLKGQGQTLSGSPVGNFSNFSPKPIQANRAPTTADTGYEIGQLWADTNGTTMYGLSAVSGGSATWNLLGPGASDVDTLTGDSGGALSPSGGNINVVALDTNTVVGSGSTLTITPTSSGYPITPYVVGSSGQAGYTTIQSAINAANAAGGGIIYVQPGNYTENLTLFSNVALVGVPGNSDYGTTGNTTVLVGTHTPPTTGSVSIVNILLESATDVFSSAAAGSCAIILENLLTLITNGYLFNLPNWTGDLVVYNLGDASTNNGVVNNTGGSFCFFVSATLGAGTGNTMITSGNVEMQEIDLKCPWNAQTGTDFSCDYVIFDSAVTLSNNSTGSFKNCTFNSGSSASITMSSSAAVSLLHSIVDSTNTPAIAGAGAGTLTLGNVTFPNDTTLAGTLTTAYENSKTGELNVAGNLVLDNVATQLQMNGGAATDFIGQATLVLGTATVANTNIAANDRIFLTRADANSSTALGELTITAQTASTSFVITALDPADGSTTITGDTSVVNYFIVRQN